VEQEENDAAVLAIDHGLIPRVARPFGLLGHGFGSIAQTQALPFLFAKPTLSHPGIRVIRHVPVLWSQEQSLGSLHLGTRPDSSSERVATEIRDLTGHLLICGRTGSGKTTTLRNILRQTQELSDPIPFLFLDFAQSLNLQDWEFTNPTKTCFHEAGQEDLGLPMPSLGLLDFRTPASFDSYIWQISELLSNWMPTEGIISILMMEVLQSVFGSLVSKDGHYWIHGEPMVPSLDSLVQHVDQFFNSPAGLRYAPELRTNLMGALITRFQRLQTDYFKKTLGGLSNEWMLHLTQGGNMVMSLAGTGSTQERSFLGVLILQKLRAWLRETRSSHNPNRPRLILAMDESHIMLRKSSEKDSSSISNIHAYAVRCFDEFMAEIRQLGAAVIIVDQAPSLLADSVLFSTGNKLVFPLSSGVDAECIGASLGLEQGKSRILSNLPNGLAYFRSCNSADLHLLKAVSASSTGRKAA
jgi:DNA polymerase III delta prime subunit